MRPLLLCLERLNRIEAILKLAKGMPVTVRDFDRTYRVFRWELDQAAELGWIEIKIKKQMTGRPSLLVTLKENSQTQVAKLPPPRRWLGRIISWRHQQFAMHSACNALRRGHRQFFHLQTYTDAYQRCFPHAKNRHGAASSMTRLLKHPDVRAARAWYYALSNHEVSLMERMPETSHGIRKRLDEIGSRFANRA